MMTRLVSMKINLYEHWIEHVLKRQQRELEKLIQKKHHEKFKDFHYSIPYFSD